MALRRALTYRDVLEAGRDKTLMALSLDLAEAGCLSGSGKPLTPVMVRRLRHRLDEAKQTLTGKGMQETVAIWPLMAEIRSHAKQRNLTALR
jgi:hypothetical protein